ncbi:MAG TPA: TIGR03546 family protein [Candidatus Mcinerneyibacterium sp.]|nr:TIGR03546 family protein [Candidatus Mcinerneyibacterium sp.]
MIIKWIVKILKAINSNKMPNEIAAGIAMGFLLAMMPVKNLFWITIFIITLFLKINLSMQLVSIAVLKTFIFILDPIINRIGLFLLNIKFLEPVFNFLYNMPLMPFTNYNNSIVMGSFLFGVILWYPVYRLSIAGVIKYRLNVRDKIIKSKIYKTITKLPIIKQIITLGHKLQKNYSKIK